MFSVAKLGSRKLLYIEGDCANILYWPVRCSFGGATPWDIEALILDIKSLLGSFSVSFCHVNRSANKLADFIAKFVSS